MTRSTGGGWTIVGLLAIALLLAIGVLLPVADIFAEQKDDMEQAQRELAAYRLQVARQPQLDAEFSDLQRQQSSGAAMLQGDSAALAAANMQSLVKDLVERHGGAMRSAQNLAASKSGGMEKITAQYEMSIPMGSLKAVTYELETRTPYLFFDQVEIRPESSTGGPTGAPTDLDVQWTLHGYRWTGAK